jgi:nitrite reductase/ring-hydroxylating ferredoxin subunit
LYEGAVEEVRGRDCLVCPWHGSAFDLDSGSPRRGPAANAQVKLEVRMEAGRVMARLPGRHR